MTQIFIVLQKDDNGQTTIVLASSSRETAAKACKFYSKKHECFIKTETLKDTLPAWME